MDGKLFVVVLVALFQGSFQEYIGCFSDTPAGSDLNRLTKVFLTGNSPSTCIQYCEQNDYLYAGVELGFNCYCGNSFGKYGAVSSSRCDWSCPRPYTDEKCGGDQAVAVYSTGVEKCFCQAKGDPHYNTFDETLIHFQGDCTYVLIRAGLADCGMRVLGKNQPFRGSASITTTKEITVEIWSEDTLDVVKIGQGKSLTVNGVPYNGLVLRDNFEVMTIGSYVTIFNNCGMEVMFDGKWTAKFYIPKTDAKYNQGLCGTCNDDKVDDFYLKNGTDANGLADAYALIGNSYWEPGTNENQAHCNRVEEQPECSDDIIAQIAGDAYCGLMKNTAGVFKDCIPLVDKNDHIAKLYESCEYDVCVSWEDPVLTEEQVCSHLAGLQEECNGILTNPMNFRSATLCPMECGANMRYEPSVTTIQKTCKTKDTENVQEFKGPSVEGCVCEENYLYDDGRDRCVHAEECGCMIEGNDNYWPIGDGFMSGDCLTKSVCVNEGGDVFLKDEPTSCGTNEKCNQPVPGVGICDCEDNHIRNDNGVCKEINWCDPDPCLNGGTCVREPGTYSCSCRFEYTGKHCETEIDFCDSDPCQNGGDCIPELGGYSCDCLVGFIGDNCETVENLCDSAPCLNGGVCSSSPGTYSCDCTVQYEGTNCEIEIDFCDPNPCENGGVCNPEFASYTCTCTNLFEGDNCEIEIDLCNPNPCHNDGTCTQAGETYSCACTSEYEGLHCDEVKECPGETNRIRCSSPSMGYRECAADGEIVGVTYIKDLDGSNQCHFHPNPAPAAEDYDGVSEGIYGFSGNYVWVNWGCKIRIEMCYLV